MSQTRTHVDAQDVRELASAGRRRAPAPFAEKTACEFLGARRIILLDSRHGMSVALLWRYSFNPGRMNDGASGTCLQMPGTEFSSLITSRMLPDRDSFLKSGLQGQGAGITYHGAQSTANSG